MGWFPMCYERVLTADPETLLDDELEQEDEEAGSERPEEPGTPESKDRDALQTASA